MHEFFPSLFVLYLTMAPSSTPSCCWSQRSKMRTSREEFEARKRLLGEIGRATSQLKSIFSSQYFHGWWGNAHFTSVLSTSCQLFNSLLHCSSVFSFSSKRRAGNAAAPLFFCCLFCVDVFLTAFFCCCWLACVASAFARSSGLAGAA